MILHNFKARLLVAVLTILIMPLATAGQTLHRELEITLALDSESISVTESLQFPAGTGQVKFSLRSGFKPETSDGRLVRIDNRFSPVQTERFQLTGLPDSGKVQLRYGGQMASANRRGMAGMPDFQVAGTGVYLDGSSRWRAHFDDFPLSSFTLKVQAPDGWEFLSQGQRQQQGNEFIFSQQQPQDDIYLLGGKFVRYARQHNGIELAVLLLEADANLANTYLDTSARYIDLYSELLGKYPYPAFSVVENRWQTGYGMPGFTLLGSRVLRLPFILHTSLPHEILHNWWGNGVFVDYQDGNWSEGLTAYLADHYVKELRGGDAEYRRKANERYVNFAATGRDFPLNQFLSRHSEASQAVGYSKALMLFHMIRQQLGDEKFFANLRQFWSDYRFEYASFSQLLSALFNDSTLQTSNFSRQWLAEPGAPKLGLVNTDLQQRDGRYLLQATLEQQQPGNSYELAVPVVIQFADGSSERELISMTTRQLPISWQFERQPTRLQVDPTYDVFRLLLDEERPSTLGRLLGAKQQLMVLPAASDKDELAAWQQLASQWQRQFGNIKQVFDDELDSLPADQPTWLLGWNNRLLDTNRSRFNGNGQLLEPGLATLQDQSYSRSKHALVLLDPDNLRPPLGFIGADDASTIRALARKLPHYKSYGRLLFDLDSAQNRLREHLPVTGSPLSVSLAMPTTE